MNVEQLARLRYIAAVCGIEKQSMQCVEELSELQQAVCKYIRNGKCDVRNVAEEIADVYVMLEQIKFLTGITENDIDGYVDYKLLRQLKRMGVGYDTI